MYLTEFTSIFWPSEASTCMSSCWGRLSSAESWITFHNRGSCSIWWRSLLTAGWSIVSYWWNHVATRGRDWHSFSFGPFLVDPHHDRHWKRSTVSWQVSKPRGCWQDSGQCCVCPNETPFNWKKPQAGPGSSINRRKGFFLLTVTFLVNVKRKSMNVEITFINPLAH